MPPKKNNQLGLKNRLLTAAAAAATIASSSFLLLGSLLLMVLVGPNLAYAQLPDNRDDELTQTAVPEFDFNNANKSMVVLLNFTALNKAEFVGVGVSYGPPHSNIGNPPLLRVQIYDYNGTIIQQFNYWHPLFALEFQEDGKEYLKILPNAVGRFVFPFDPNAALMKVSYLHDEGANNTWAEEVISVDLRPPIPSFCDQFPDDPDCKSSDLAVVDVSTANGQQQLPILVGNSTDVTVRTTVTNNGPDKPIDATLSSRTITTPPGSDGGIVIVTPAAEAAPNENGATITTTIPSLSERQQHDQTYKIECWEPGKYNIIFQSEVASLSGAVVDDNQLNNKGQMNLEVDCSEIIPCPPPPEPLGVSIEANVTDDGSPPTTIEFRAITEGGTQPHKFRWNFDDDGSNNSNNDVKGGQLMTRQFTKLGQYNVTVTVTDSANGSRCQTASDDIIVTISDKVPPRVIVPSHIIAEATRPDGANVTFTVSATDIVDGSVPVSCQAQPGGQVQSGDTFQLGNTTVNCQATDSSNNTGYGSFPVTVQDTTPPVITVSPSPPIIAEAKGPNGANVNFTVSATDIVDGSVPVSCQAQPGGQVQSGDTFQLGTTTVNCQATDSSRNSAKGNFTVTVQDTTPPILELPNISPVEAKGPSTPVEYPPATAIDIVDPSPTVTCPPPPSPITIAGVGSKVVECEAKDKYGNTANGTFTVTVRDTTPPVVTVPPPITVEAKGPNGANVTFNVSATDIVDGSVPVSCQAQPGGQVQSGDTFQLGNTTVNCKATDSSNNTGYGSFPVTVQDTTPPILELPDIPPIEAKGPNGANNVTFNVSATDIVDGKATLGKEDVLIQEDQDGRDIRISCDPGSSNTFGLGNIGVKCYVEDSSHNRANGNFTVTVRDTTPPVVTVPPPITVEAKGPNGANVTFNVSATDIVDGTARLEEDGTTITQDQVGGNITISCTPHSGSIFGLGTAPSVPASSATSDTVFIQSAPPSASVSCDATDNSGNSAKGNFTVTVRDTTAPEIIVWYNDGETERKVEDGDTIAVEATGPNGASEKSIFDSLEYYATDIVDGSVEVSCSSPSGFTFPVGDTDVSCLAFDAAENTGTKSFTVTVTTCSPGQHLDPIENVCVPDAPPAPIQPPCSPGQHLDPIENVCVPDAPPAPIQPLVSSGPSECEEGEELVDGECQEIDEGGGEEGGGEGDEGGGEGDEGGGEGDEDFN